MAQVVELSAASAAAAAAEEERVALAGGESSFTGVAAWETSGRRGGRVGVVAVAAAAVAAFGAGALVGWAATAGGGGDGGAATAVPGLQPEEALGDVAAVATDDHRCSDVGLKVLRDGGGAADAAVAAALCLGVVHPHSSGIGGGAFALYAPAASIEAGGDAGVGVEVIDSREKAPAAAHRDMYVNASDRSLVGGAAVAVPGELLGLHTLWSRHGNKEWAELCEPAAALAEEMTVGPSLAAALAGSGESLRQTSPVASRPFFHDAGSGQPLGEGDVLRRPELAATLRRVGALGPRAALYSDDVARTLTAEIRAAGGIMTEADLTQYEPTIRAPLSASVLGGTLYGVPPPSSGGATIIQALSIIGGYESPLVGVDASLRAHRLAEALKHAFASRMALGDPAYAPNVTAVLADMSDADFNAALRAQTSDAAVLNLTQYGGEWNQLPEDHGTSHLSIVDAQGNAAAMTTTINTHFGSKVISESTGIVLNNEMDDFSTPGQVNAYGLAPSEANFVAPGKRPLSSMSPTVFTRADGKKVVVGASGGPRIISATLQALVRLLLLGDSAYDAVHAPRIHDQLIPNECMVEDRTLADGTVISVAQKVRQGLEQRGHEVVPTESVGVCQLIAVEGSSGRLHAVSDRRKGGRPAAF